VASGAGLEPGAPRIMPKHSCGDALAKLCTHTPHRLAGSFPVCHALHDGSRHSTGEFGLVIAQGVIACGRSSVDARLQVSQVAQRADDSPADLLDHLSDIGIGGRLDFDKAWLEVLVIAIEIHPL
jgi:hypothetical protein